MRVSAELMRNNILQGEKIPEIGDPVPYNGKYAIEIPSFVNVDMDESVPCADYILPVDGGDIYSKIFQGVLASYPMYDHILFNPLLTADDMGDLDIVGTLPDGSITRAQFGRAGNVFQPPYHTTNQIGTAPCSVALLPANKSVSPQRDGLLITTTMDISTETNGAGAREFMVYWKIYQFECTKDVNADGGAFAGMNSPAIRNIIEIDQEPSDLEVFISVDDGVKYHPIGRLEPTAFCVAGTKIRLAFKNTGDVKYYIASYAVMF